MTVGVVVTILGSFQRWLVTGTVGRTSYELLGLVRRLGFTPSGTARTAVAAWPVMPLVLTAGLVAVWWGWRRAGAAVAALGAVYAGAVGGVIAFAAPETRIVEVSYGPRVTAVGAAIVLTGAVLVFFTARSPADSGHPAAPAVCPS